MKYKVITISGEVASGKSSIANQLLSRLPEWKRVNTGQRFRDYLESKGMTIQQVSHLSDEKHIEFDNSQAELMKNGSNLIVEGRLAGWLARDFEHVFRVFCFAPMDVRIERYIQRDSVSVQKAKKDIKYRDSRDAKKFQKIYKIDDYRDPRFYSFLLDTSELTPDELANIILSEANLN